MVPVAPESRDRIIKATNSQTQIPVASLRATEKIHRDIEEFLRPHGLYYDRRKNFYKNEKRPIEQILSISHLAQSVMAIALQRPNDARARPSSLLKRDADYETVFNSKYPIALYLSCAKLIKAVDRFRFVDPKHQTNLRFYATMYLGCLLTNSAAPSPEEIASANTAGVTDNIVQEALKRVMTTYDKLGASDQVAKGIELLAHLKMELSLRFPIPAHRARSQKHLISEHVRTSSGSTRNQ